MIHKITLLLLAALFATNLLFAQQTVTVSASNSDISDNLDLKAVAYSFGKAKNLEKFEKMLNDPKKQISNLDLNYDGYVDYLRVIEVNENGVIIIVIQAVIGQDLYQDVATINVDARDKERVYVQVIGNEYIYGSSYIIEPVYLYTPPIYGFFWYPRHTVWYSPYYWSYYPVYYRHRRPHSIRDYHYHMYEHYHHFECRYVPHRQIDVDMNRYKKYHRNDFEQKHPDQSFNHRNGGIENRQELVERRSSSPNTENRRSTRPSDENKSKTVTPNWESSQPSRRPSSSDGKRYSAPVNQTPTKSTTIEGPRRESDSRSRVVEPSTKSSSPGVENENRNRNNSSTAPTQKSAPTVTTKPAESRSSNNNRSVSSPSDRKPETVKENRSESSKPTVKQAEPARRSSSESKKPAVQQNKQETKKSDSSTSKSSGKSSSSSTEKSKESNRR